MEMVEPSFDHSTFSKNRLRLLQHRVSREFFDAVVMQADRLHLLSDEHFSVDSTLIEAAATPLPLRAGYFVAAAYNLVRLARLNAGYRRLRSPHAARGPLAFLQPHQATPTFAERHTRSRSYPSHFAKFNSLLMRPASDRRVRVSGANGKCNDGRGEFGWGVRGVAAIGNVNEILDGHVVLDLECLDRIYLNAYVPKLQVGGQVVTFFSQHRNQPIASPVLFQKMGEAFRHGVGSFAKRHKIPILRFARRDRQIDLIQPYFKADTQPGVIAIGVAQEFQSVLTAYDRSAKAGEFKAAGSRYAFVKEDRRVTVYYFYIVDAEFGLGFIKLCAYFPYPGKVWVNGHEWAKRQAEADELAFTELANGFAACGRPHPLAGHLRPSRAR
jgi:hypothetical protein